MQAHERGHMDTNCDMLLFIGALVHTLDCATSQHNAQKYSILPLH